MTVSVRARAGAHVVWPAGVVSLDLAVVVRRGVQEAGAVVVTEPDGADPWFWVRVTADGYGGWCVEESLSESSALAVEDPARPGWVDELLVFLDQLDSRRGRRCLTS